jgi:chaperone modulatory protein CbpM
MEKFPMKKVHNIHIRVEELSRITCISVEFITGLVEHGVLDPVNDFGNEQDFEERTIVIVKKAVRIKNDFDTDIAGVALALELMNRLDKTRVENQSLRNQLSRFVVK